MGQAKRRATQIRPKAVGGGIFGRSSNFDKCRLELAGDVISGRFMGPDASDNCVKVGDPAITLLEKLHLKPSEAAFSTFFRDNFWLGVVSDIISGVAVYSACMGVHATFGESWLYSGRPMLLFGRPDPFYASFLSST